MKKVRIRRLKVAGDEQGSNDLIKREVDWLAEDSRPLKLDQELLPSIKTEEDHFHTDAEANAVQEFTPVPQTDEYLKTELILDEECTENIHDSEENWKQHVIDDPQLVDAGITVKKDENGEVSSPSDSPKRLRNVDVRMLSNQLGEAQSITPGPPSTDDDSIKSNQNSTFVCEECGSSFTRKGSLQTHMLRKHCGQAEPRFECEICSRSLTTKAALKVHLRMHSKDRRREFACDLCGNTFYRKNHLNRHKKIHSGDLYPCNVCGHRFTQKESLKRHMVRSEHFDKPQQFPPQSSNKDVASIKTELMSDEEFIDEVNRSESVGHTEGTKQFALAGDNKEHTGAVESVTCEVCHNSYPEKLIRAHMSLKHSDKAYNCQFCSQVYWNKSTFEKHISRHNDNRPVPYACEQCGFKFVSKANLKHHMVTHTKYRKPEFDCELCEKKFYSRNGWKQHLKTHTGETVICEVCGAHFTQTPGLKRHMLRKHTGKTQQFTADSQTANDD